MKYLAPCLLFALIALGCDTSSAELADAEPVQLSADQATFPFGLTLASTGSGSLDASRRKVCYIEIGTGKTQCVTNRSGLASNQALSWDGSVPVQQYGAATSAPFNVLSSLRGYRDVIQFEVGKEYMMEICGAGNTFTFLYIGSSVPDFSGNGEVRGVHFAYTDNGLPGRPDQYGVGGQLELQSQSEPSPSIADVVPILLFAPISSGPACTF